MIMTFIFLQRLQQSSLLEIGCKWCIVNLGILIQLETKLQWWPILLHPTTTPLLCPALSCWIRTVDSSWMLSSPEVQWGKLAVQITLSSYFWSVSCCDYSFCVSVTLANLGGWASQLNTPGISARSAPSYPAARTLPHPSLPVPHLLCSWLSPSVCCISLCQLTQETRLEPLLAAAAGCHLHRWQTLCRGSLRISPTGIFHYPVRGNGRGGGGWADVISRGVRVNQQSGHMLSRSVIQMEMHGSCNGHSRSRFTWSTCREGLLQSDFISISKIMFLGKRSHFTRHPLPSHVLFPRADAGCLTVY